MKNIDCIIDVGPQSQNDDCCLLVMSCDAYDDLWAPFFTLLNRYWPDHLLPVYLGAENKSLQNATVVSLRSSAGSRNWTGRLLGYLQQLRQQYVIIMLDDFFLRKTVSTSEVIQCLEFARSHNAIQVRLIPLPGPTVFVNDETFIGECPHGLPYRLNSQGAIWDRAKLIKLLRPGESIWQFEHNGNQRAMAYPSGFYSVRRAVLHYQGLFAHHVIEKGKWFPHEKWIFRRQNVSCDFSRRPTLSWTQTAIYQSAVTLDRVLAIFPWRVKSWLKQSLKGILRPILYKQFSRMHGSNQPSASTEE